MQDFIDANAGSHVRFALTVTADKDEDGNIDFTDTYEFVLYLNASSVGG